MTDNNDAFPVETVLSDGSVFRVVPVDTGLRTIRAWAEHPWPMSPAQALALRDRLGWTSSPTDEEMFTTDHGIGEKDAWFIAVENGRSTRTVSGFHLSLTCRIPKPVRPEAVPIAAYRGQGLRGLRPGPHRRLRQGHTLAQPRRPVSKMGPAQRGIGGHGHRRPCRVRRRHLPGGQ